MAQPHPIARHNPIETQLLDAIIEFELGRRLPGVAPFFARSDPVTNSVLNLRTKEAVLELQLCATQLGLPSHRYTAKSFRVTLATESEAANLPQESINQIGGWSHGSTVSSNAYSRANSVNNTLTLFDRAAQSNNRNLNVDPSSSTSRPQSN